MSKLIICVIILVMGAAVGAFCWPYTINTWLIFFGKAPQIVWWQGALIGFCPFIGQFSVLAVVVTWVMMLFLV